MITLLERKMIDMVNDERRKKGKPELRVSLTLCNIARKHSRYQRIFRTVFHVAPITATNPGDRIIQGGYQYKACGENVATTPTLLSSHNGLMNSPGHYRNIMGDWNEIGIGIVTEPNGQLYVTQLFAVPFYATDQKIGFVIKKIS